jgi:hypothetical protein
MSLADIKNYRIVAFQGASSAVIQALLAEIAEKLSTRGLRVAGLVESASSGPNPCKSMELRSLEDGHRFVISQDLGPGSEACNLHPEGLALACAAVEQSIVRGADVVILSKFGKQEALGSGLIDAFSAAFAAGVPIMTSVSPALMSEWRHFVGEFSECVTPDAARCASWLDGWLHDCVTGPHIPDLVRPAIGRATSA